MTSRRRRFRVDRDAEGFHRIPVTWPTASKELFVARPGDLVQMSDDTGDQRFAFSAAADSKPETHLGSLPRPALGHHGMSRVTTADSAL